MGSFPETLIDPLNLREACFATLPQVASSIRKSFHALYN